MKTTHTLILIENVHPKIRSNTGSSILGFSLKYSHQQFGRKHLQIIIQNLQKLFWIQVFPSSKRRNPTIPSF